jgi:hypothetical protein
MRGQRKSKLIFEFNFLDIFYVIDGEEQDQLKLRC